MFGLVPHLSYVEKITIPRSVDPFHKFGHNDQASELFWEGILGQTENFSASHLHISTDEHINIGWN